MPIDVTSTIEGQALIDLELRVKNQTVSLLGPSVFFHGTRITENIFGCAAQTLLLRTTDLAYVDTLLKAVMADGTPKLRFRLGQGSERTIWYPWQNHLLLEYDAKADGLGEEAGHLVRISTIDMLFLIDRPSRTSSYRGSISSIVQKIAERNGITDTVIEPTSGDGLFIQSFCGDTEFIRDRLVKRARSQKDRGNYLFYMRDNVIHFHSPDYQADLKTINYYQTGGAGLFQKDLSQQRIVDGASGVRMISYDPYSGSAKEILSDRSKIVRYGNTTPKLSNVVEAERNIMHHVGMNRANEADVITQNSYEAVHQGIFELHLTLMKNPLIRAGDLLQININPGSTKVSTWSGHYLVSCAEQTIDKGSLKSVYTLIRGEQFSPNVSAIPLRTGEVGTIENENAALGENLNLRETQNSLLTKGAGRVNSSGVLLSVQDKNKAPIPLS